MDKKSNNKNNVIIHWKKLSKEDKESIKLSLKLLNRKLCNIDAKTIPSTVNKLIDSLSEYKEINNKLTNNNNILMQTIEQLKFSKILDADTFKKKAKDFGSKAQEEIKKYKEKFHNKNEKHLSEVYKYKSADILEIILEPISNIKVAIKSGKTQNSKELKNYLIGFEMLINQLEAAMFEEGLSLIKPNVGDKFEPKYQTALSTISNKKQKNKIIEIKRYGYMLHDRVLIPATVIIGK